MTNNLPARGYFQGLIDHDLDAIRATLGDTGTYEDPNTGGPIRSEALKGHISGLRAAFPDISFEIESHADTGPDSAAVQWVMRGTNSGSMLGLPPAGKSVALHGADFFTFSDGRIRTDTGYFDGGATPRQLGLDVIVQPKQIGPFAFGTSTVLQSGKQALPSAFSITYLEAPGPEEVAKVREGSRASLMEMLSMEEFIGATASTVGTRMVTISAWTNADAPRRVKREGAQAEAMKQFHDGSLASAGRTSVWTLARDNGLMLRCDACGTMTRNPAPGAACKCGTPLPEPPPFW